MSDDIGILDVAGVEAPVVDSDITPLETTPVEISAEGAEQTPEQIAESTDATDEGKTPEQIAEAKAKVEETKTAEAIAKATPDGVRKSLKALRDADPKNAAVVKELHGAFERWNAAKQIFPKGVAEMKAAKEFADLVGGPEGYQKLNETVEAVKASDQKLYAGDRTLVDDVVNDLKNENKLEALNTIVPAFLDALKTNNIDAYYTTFAPHFLDGLKQVNINGAIGGLTKALTLGADATPEQIKAAVATAAEITQGMDKWFKGLEQTATQSKSKELDPERVKLKSEREAFAKEQETFKTNQTKDFQASVATEAMKTDNNSLGKSLAPFLKMPFFKGFTKQNLTPLAVQCQTDLRAALKADGIYQAAMKQRWAAKTPDRAGLLEYHNNKVKEISEGVVRNVVQTMYPGYAKGGAAAGRVAAADVKKDANKELDKSSAETGKPVYVGTKPAWDAIDWDKDTKQLLYITGKAYLKGSGRFVTWRK